MANRLSRPLNKEAIKKADVEWYKKHPELLKIETAIPTSAADPEQADLYYEWQALYQKHGGEVEGPEDQFSNNKIGQLIQPCPQQENNWIDLQYLYADGQGVSGTRYEVIDTRYDEVVAGGILDEQGQSHVDLPITIHAVNVRYLDDPIEVETLRESTPHMNAANPGWFERMIEEINAAGQWSWGVIQGDFNETPTIGQIATNALVTAVPVVDQIADARDIVAIVKRMVWENKSDTATWFDLFQTMIGLIPSLGSLLKGVIKAIWHGAKVQEMLKLFNYFKKGNGIKWLKELRSGKLNDYAQQGAQKAHQIFNALIDKLTQLKARVPKALSETHQTIDKTLERLNILKGQINQKFDEIAEIIKDKLGKSLDETKIEYSGSQTKTRLSKRQAMEEPGVDGVKNVDPKVVSGGGSKVEMDGHKIYDSDFSPLGSNPEAQYRFSDPDFRKTGGDVYLGENVGTSYFEVRKNVKGKSLFVGDVKVDNMLDLTDPYVLKQMNVNSGKLTEKVDNLKQQGEIYGYTNKISNQAYNEGYSGIIYPSSRKASGNNKAVVLFGGRYDPKSIDTIMDRPIKGK